MTEYKPAPKRCPVPLFNPKKGHVETCYKPASVLDVERTKLAGGTPVYICQRCAEAEHPELAPPPPIHPGLPIFGGQYEGLRSKPNENRAQRKWAGAVKEQTA